ncbi:MAG: hypothetical protein PHW03_07670 [Eubacteriales bacterium]|nr:hypothetical protein [Eubacteriales bacterium]MDD4390649.1 hypothetical protein [Eubacteriales bacterium]
MRFYEICAIPKPGSAKKKKKTNGYKDKHKRFCFYCKTPSAERHEVFGGSNRQISIDHRFQVDLCADCHREMQANITDQGKERNRYWRQHYQKLYEDRLMESGVPGKQARELWLLLIGRNYKDD